MDLLVSESLRDSARSSFLPLALGPWGGEQHALAALAALPWLALVGPDLPRPALDLPWPSSDLGGLEVGMAAMGPYGQQKGKRKEIVPASDFMWSWALRYLHYLHYSMSVGPQAGSKASRKSLRSFFWRRRTSAHFAGDCLAPLPYHRPGLDWLHHHSPCGPQSDDSGRDWPLVLHAHRLFNDESDVRDWSRLIATEPEPQQGGDADADAEYNGRREAQTVYL